MQRIIRTTLSIAIICLLITIGAFFIWRDRIYPNISLAGINLENTTKEQAEILLTNKINLYSSQGIEIKFKERSWQLTPDKIDLQINTSNNIDKAYQAYDRNPILFIRSFITQKPIPLEVSYNQDKWRNFIDKELRSIEIEVQDAGIDLLNNEIVLSPQVLGIEVEADKLEKVLQQQLRLLDTTPLIIPTKNLEPEISDEMVSINLDTLNQALTKNINLTHKNKSWEITPDTFIDWIKLNKEKTLTGKKIKITLNFTLAENYLRSNISPDITTPAKNALFKTEGDKVVAFELGQDGQDIDTILLIPQIESALLSTQENVSLEIPLTITKAQIRGDNATEMGITELVATGESDFSGSPNNRIHNIKIGSNLFNGILINPGEEFSFNSILGEVDAANGFKAELVIKPDGIKPEYGGGLCQVSTTAFRAALNAGLPITQRRNHSLLVSYYKPNGTDATIYPGVHDVKFINNTGNNILIQTRIVGSKLYFDFYGTNDGRKIVVTDPVYTSSFISPGEPKYIESNTLAKGVKEKIGNAFQGVSTVFYRTTTMPDGEEVKDTFTSKYKPWKAIYLIGTKE